MPGFAIARGGALSCVTLAWSGIVTLALLKVIGFFLPLRVREEHERIGLDVSLHGESLQ